MTAFANPIPDPTAGKPSRARRWIPISLRMFVATLVLIGVGSSLWGAVAGYRQHLAIREIERLGGRVSMQTTGPNWLRNLVGDEWMRLFDKSDWVQLDGTHATDGTLRQIAVLSDTQTLWLEGTQVTNAGLRHLTSMTDLKYLRLNGTQVSDQGLENISDLKTLTTIGLNHTRITDAGLRRLGRLPNLEVLLLSDTAVTESGVAAWKQAHPNSEVIIERVLVTPPDPVPTESDIVRFRFCHTRSRAHTSDGIKDLPETDFGELLFERKTGRCLYRYWYDGVHEHPLGYRIDRLDLHNEKREPRDRVQLPLKSAVAFDGKRYWIASYDLYRPSLHADRVYIFEEGADLDSGAGIDKAYASLKPWCMQAPLHALAAGVSSDAIERNTLHRAIQASRQTKSYGPHACDITLGGWNYVVSLDQSYLGIRFIAVRHAGGWSGMWPYPLPMSFTVERENAYDMNSEELDSLTNPDGYIDGSTFVAP